MSGPRSFQFPAILPAAAVLCLAFSAGPAATLDVPTQYGSIDAALTAAQNGDEIRVQSSHSDESSWIDVSNKSVTIRSYNADYSQPQSGATWFGFTGTGNNEGYAVQLENSTLTIEGFGYISCLDCSMFVVGNNSTLNVEDCHFEGTKQADTAAIDTGPMGQSSNPATPVENVTININNSTFNDNGRGVWTRSHRGTSSLTITNSEFTANTSWDIEWRTGAGDHTYTFIDSLLQSNVNQTQRLYAFANTNPSEVTNYNVHFERVHFILNNGARTPMIMGGIEDAAHADSSWTLNAVNCVIDLRAAQENAESSAILALTEATRRGSATLTHCTILTGNSQQAGMRLRGGPASVFTMRNSIVDGPGTALKNEGTGVVNSGLNLFNTPTLTFGTGTINLSGEEIIGVSPMFVDRDGGDFHLASGSPAISTGEDLGVADDFEGNPRPNPVGSMPDLGALESPEGDVILELNVPTDYASIGEALTAAGDGDFIRVRSDHIDDTVSYDLTGKSVTIRSYNSDFTVPEPGASWIASTGTGNNNGHALLIEDGSLTIEGFGQLTCSDGSMLVVGNNATLNVEACTFTGTGQADTAAVDTRGVASAPGTSENVTININNSLFTGNGRSIWTRNITGTGEVNVSKTEITGNTSWCVEFRTMDGDHTLNFVDSVLQTAANATMRLYAFGNVDPGKITNYNVNVDRSHFLLSGNARTPFIMGGVEAAAHPDSSWTLHATNCVIDLRSAAINAETSGIISLPDATRRGMATLDHCTIVTGDPLHSGMRLRGGPDSTFTIRNSIVDGPGTALKNEGTGIVASGYNLFNTPTLTDGSGTINLSGNEIIGESPLFVDRAGGDFSLSPASPAIAAGENLGVVVDINGDPRPNPSGSNPDLGAYESEAGDVLDELFVPAVYPTIADALAAAGDGEEIRVASNHQDGSNLVLLSGKAITVRSYDVAYANPQAGARWVASTGTGTNEGYAILLDDATLTIDGFDQLTCNDGSMVILGNSSTLNVESSTFTGTSQANTSAIDTLGMPSLPGQSMDISVNLNNTSFTGNARSIWTRSIIGTNEVNVVNSVISGNSSWCVEFRAHEGDHTLNFIDSVMSSAVNATMRLYAFGNVDSTLVTNYKVNVDRSHFILTGGARTPFIMGGVEDAAHPSSSWTLNATNCVIDLRSALANLETSAMLSLSESTRRGTATFQHCTILTGDDMHSGMRLRGGPNSVFTLQNSIVDGPGTAFKNEGSGSVVSGINLINMPIITDGSPGTTLSGDEITGVSPEFIDRAGGDFRLAANSPALEAGANLGVMVDINGDPRPNPPGSNPDLGAFEMPGDTPIMLGDINGDGIINVADVTELANLVKAGTPPPNAVGDINDDGVVNEADVSALAAMIVD